MGRKKLYESDEERKAALKAAQKRYYEANAERRRAQNLAYYFTHKEIAAEKARARYERTKELKAVPVNE